MNSEAWFPIPLYEYIHRDDSPRKTIAITPSLDLDNSASEPLLTPPLASSSSSSSASDSNIKITRHIEDTVLPETATLGRNLLWSSAYILVISRVIGSGIFATPGSIVKTTGSVALAMLLWVAGAVLVWCGMIIGLEYGCMLPRSGVAVQAVLFGFTASNCIIFGEYVLFAFGVEPTEYSQKTLALGLLTAITIIYGCFLKTGIAIQNFLGWIKVGLVLSRRLLESTFRSLALENPKVRSYEQGRLAGMDYGRIRIGVGVHFQTAVFKVSYSYAGLGNLNNVLNEVKDGVQTLKTVAPAALLTSCLLYLWVNFAYFSVVPLEEVKEYGELIAALFFERVFAEKFGRIVLPLAIAVSAAGDAMVVTFTLARVNQEIARQGFLPYSHLFSSSKPFNAPLGGLILYYIPSFLVIAIPPRGDVYNFILDVEGYPGQFAALATSFGLIWLRKKRSDLHRLFKAWLPAVWLRIVICSALIAAPFFPPKDGHADVGFFYATYAIVGIGIIIFGILYWYLQFVGLPWWYGYKVEEEVDVLSHGTSITKLIHVKTL